jgi:hypothetical protein
MSFEGAHAGCLYGLERPWTKSSRFHSVRLVANDRAVMAPGLRGEPTT